MNSYEQRIENKRERYQQLAHAARATASTKDKQLNQLADCMNGTPILIGHHSERRHRRDMDKIRNGTYQVIDLQRKADYYEHKAETYGSNGISQDDPEAITKLEDKLQRMAERQERMKAANKQARANGEDQPHPGWELSNNNGNMRNVKQRIEQLKAKAAMTAKEKTVKGVRVVDNVEDNRLQMFFPGKPAANVIAALKSGGFRWTPSLGCWQAYLNNRSQYQSQRIIELI